MGNLSSVVMLALCKEQLSKSVGLWGWLVFIWWGWISVTLLCSSPGSSGLLANLFSQCWSLVFGFSAAIQARAAQSVAHAPAHYITWVPVRNIESCPLQDYWFRIFTFNKIPSLFTCTWMFEKHCSNPEHSTVCVCSEWVTGVQWGTDSYSLQVAT